MGKIEKILKKGPVEGQTTEVYPVTSTKAVYDENNKRLDNIITGLQESVYLNNPIPISTENTTESKAQNVKNIADYVEKAKAAGIADVNGMAVTCIINNNYSAVGYLYAENTICGIEIDNGLEAPVFFVVDPDGTYGENSVLINGLSGQVTSDMLVEGARKPIIITGDMTEVDEETYQKLLSDDVDVVFKSEDNLCILTFKTEDTTSLSLVFTGLSLEGDTTDDLWFYGYEVSITKDSPHNCTINQWYNDTLSTFLGLSSFIDKSALSPVLQEIDLTGTDADRKAKLDKFETDWKALTGASDLIGARFVGFVDVESGLEVIFSYNASNGYWSGLNKFADGVTSVTISPLDGSLTITPLFSHLEAITIYTDNTPEHMQANLDNIAAYEANLQALGVTNVDGIMIPIKFEDDPENIAITFPFSGYITKYSSFYDGIVSTLNGAYNPRVITINGQQGEDGGKVVFETIALEKQLDIYTPKSLNAKSLEAITIKTDNSTASKAANVAAIKAYVDNLTALGVDVTKGCTIPFVGSPSEYCGILFGRGDDYYEGVCNSHSTRVTLGVAINIDGAFYATNNINTISEYQDLTTIAKKIIPAINEVNALAKGYSTIFTPIELTTETAQNKTAIDARVAAFTAQGISLTNGCCIPVTYKGVYAGNISLINGDWYGLLVKNTNNPADNINIKLSADGTITEGNSAQ